MSEIDIIFSKLTKYYKMNASQTHFNNSQNLVYKGHIVNFGLLIILGYHGSMLSVFPKDHSLPPNNNGDTRCQIFRHFV